MSIYNILSKANYLNTTFEFDNNYISITYYSISKNIKEDLENILKDILHINDNNELIVLTDKDFNKNSGYVNYNNKTNCLIIVDINVSIDHKFNFVLNTSNKYLLFNHVYNNISVSYNKDIGEGNGSVNYKTNNGTICEQYVLNVINK